MIAAVFLAGVLVGLVAACVAVMAGRADARRDADVRRLVEADRRRAASRTRRVS